jgi:hypothetical protein
VRVDGVAGAHARVAFGGDIFVPASWLMLAGEGEEAAEEGGGGARVGAGARGHLGLLAEPLHALHAARGVCALEWNRT